ncbi:MAG: succinylglutamate desuccinylase/aspartoacylase family protein [Candidatus Bathyarchaeota archaeon]
MSFQVEDTVIERGTAHRGWVEIGEASTHTVKMPYIVINGAKDGPTLTILGGVHAVECTPVEAIYRLADSIDPVELSGTLILVPVVNTEGFHARKPYHNILDHLNQNKVFPGDAEASITKRVAFHVFDKFVSKSDALIDAHSADIGEDVTRGIFIFKTENRELYRKMVELASCYRPALIETTTIAGNTGEAVNVYGIPCLMIESGAPYPIREADVNYHYDGAMNVMKFMGMLDGEAERSTPLIDPPSERLWAKKGGVWRRQVEAGQRVEKGASVGVVCNLLGEVIQVIYAPTDGIVSFLRVHYSVNAGDTLLWVAKA